MSGMRGRDTDGGIGEEVIWNQLQLGVGGILWIQEVLAFFSLLVFCNLI
jgi:hypothetical protein